MPRTCLGCGAENNEQDAFCHDCGQSLAPKTEWWWQPQLFIVVGVILGVLVAAGLIYDAVREETAECVRADFTIMEALEVTDLVYAVKADHGLRVGPVNEAWYMATPAGATWVTNMAPREPKAGNSGLIFPLNQTALEASIMGRQIGLGAPATEGFANNDDGAIEARSCAALRGRRGGSG